MPLARSAPVGVFVSLPSLPFQPKLVVLAQAEDHFTLLLASATATWYSAPGALELAAKPKVLVPTVKVALGVTLGENSHLTSKLMVAGESLASVTKAPTVLTVASVTSWPPSS
ncbi:hypothetical protein D3C87_1730940 [compost metagenome]